MPDESRHALVLVSKSRPRALLVIGGGGVIVLLALLLTRSCTFSPSFTFVYAPNQQQEEIPKTANETSVVAREKSLPRIDVRATDPPNVAVYNPIVRITRWRAGDIVYGEVANDGTVTGNFSLSLLNVGGRPAKGVQAKWEIRDNGFKISSPDEWLDAIKKPRWQPHDLEPGKLVTFGYGPHISAAGTGRLELTLRIAYVDPGSGELQEAVRNFFTDYVLERGESRQYALSPR